MKKPYLHLVLAEIFLLMPTLFGYSSNTILTDNHNRSVIVLGMRTDVDFDLVYACDHIFWQRLCQHNQAVTVLVDLDTKHVDRYREVGFNYIDDGIPVAAKYLADHYNCEQEKPQATHITWQFEASRPQFIQDLILFFCHLADDECLDESDKPSFCLSDGSPYLVGHLAHYLQAKIQLVERVITSIPLDTASNSPLPWKNIISSDPNSPYFIAIVETYRMMQKSAGILNERFNFDINGEKNLEEAILESICNIDGTVNHEKLNSLYALTISYFSDFAAVITYADHVFCAPANSTIIIVTSEDYRPLLIPLLEFIGFKNNGFIIMSDGNQTKYDCFSNYLEHFLPPSEEALNNANFEG